jgi:ligand-binding sensor domain-containing protein/DNA-binding CsgD family transcriptional regulator
MLILAILMRKHNFSLQFIFYIASLFLLMFPFSLFAYQNLPGMPYVINYSRTEYMGGSQSWMIDQASDGKIYFANNSGLLQFDGVNWKVFPLENGMIIRSVFCDSDGRIYVGAYNEFGYFYPDYKGELVYTSLKTSLNGNDKDFDEVWKIYKIKDEIYFQSFQQIIILKDKELNVIKADGIFHFSHVVQEQLYVNDREKGILRLSENKLLPLLGTAPLKGKEIWSMIPLENEILIATADQGLFLYDGVRLVEWDTECSKHLMDKQLYSALQLDDNTIAFGTVQDGVLIANMDGDILKIINKKSGLQNNTILGLFLDNLNNLWLATDNGIDFIELSSPISYLDGRVGLSAGYTMKKYKENIYMGTNQGLFSMNWEQFQSSSNQSDFKLVENVKGQVWKLQIIDGRLFCGTNNGSYILEDNGFRKLSDVPGAWMFVQMDSVSIIGGTYNKLTLYRQSQGNWNYIKELEGFNESSRIMVKGTNNSIWMAHGFIGIFNIVLNDNFDSVTSYALYNSNNGFPNDFGLNVCEIDDEILFTAEDGFYSYDEKTNKFIQTSKFNDLIQFNASSKVIQDELKDIWYYTDKIIGVLRRQEDGNYANVYLPFNTLQKDIIGGFEEVVHIDQWNIFFGSNEGFAHFKPDYSKDYRAAYNSYISQVILSQNDSVIFNGNVSKDSLNTPILSFSNNALTFSFAANDYENSSDLVYATQLLGYDEQWTPWSERNEREFTNLKEGKYTLFVKARNIYGVESRITSYDFEILPPWTRTVYAYVLYGFLGVLFLLLLILIIRKRFEAAKRREKKIEQEKYRKKEEEMKLKSLEDEKEIIRLRNEKLRAAMILKDKELANSTMNMIQKNKLLNNVKSELRKLNSSDVSPELRTKIQGINKKINRELNAENQWEVFETHFENVHEAFLKRLKEAYPDLSPRELKLCAFLRMNISSKEIAVLMNISTRGVEISRYRLRKKLDLDRNQNLTDFILSF